MSRRTLETFERVEITHKSFELRMCVRAHRHNDRRQRTWIGALRLSRKEGKAVTCQALQVWPQILRLFEKGWNKFYLLYIRSQDFTLSCQWVSNKTYVAPKNWYLSLTKLILSSRLQVNNTGREDMNISINRMRKTVVWQIPREQTRSAFSDVSFQITTHPHQERMTRKGMW